MSTEARHFVVDRVVDHIAILQGDDGELHRLDTSRVPVALREGAVLRARRSADGAIDESTVELDEEETARRLAEAGELLDDLKQRDPGGDVIL